MDPMDAQASSDAAPAKRGRTLAMMAKYVGVSASQTVVELAVFALLGLVLDRQIANAAAIACSATYQFLMNRSVTFKSSSSMGRSVALFVLLWLWNLAFSSFVLAHAPALGVDPLLAKLGCMACQGVWGWLLSRYVIFR
ncbi:GtrA family protein [Eggerthella guodeyinii]|uniref:GtrA family protein n=3 Tax=Eggerthellaceae TaxID=1643826 RepID=A0A6L7INZ3_9ACTN|nr:GtrA family protein [Eggerthella hominis]QOS67776.1 GtrA family protein [Eggerthella guodeyinii]